MKEKIKQIFEESISVKQSSLKENLDAIVESVDLITSALKDHKKILIFGNGGSAADSQHIAAEFVGRFKKERKGLAAIALTTDTSAITALANDYHYEFIFARQVEALGQKGDVVLGISTSGNSKNVIEGLKKSKECGLHTISLTGCDGGLIKPLTQINMNVPSNNTARVQESHICISHIICELVEDSFC